MYTLQCIVYIVNYTVCNTYTLCVSGYWIYKQYSAIFRVIPRILNCLRCINMSIVLYLRCVHCSTIQCKCFSPMSLFSVNYFTYVVLHTLCTVYTSYIGNSMLVVCKYQLMHWIHTSCWSHRVIDIGDNTKDNYEEGIMYNTYNVHNIPIISRIKFILY